MKNLRLSTVAFVILLAALALPALSQENTKVEVNFIYAFELGFGSYDIGGLDVQVYKLPVAYTFKDFMGNDRLNLKVGSPLYYGRFRFRRMLTDGTKLRVDQDVMAYIPGIELEYQAVNNRYVKPFANLGMA